MMELNRKITSKSDKIKTANKLLKTKLNPNIVLIDLVKAVKKELVATPDIGCPEILPV